MPIRCFTCGKVLANKWDLFDEKTKENENKAQVLDDLGIVRICCRRMMLGHVDMISKLLPYESGHKDK